MTLSRVQQAIHQATASDVRNCYAGGGHIDDTDASNILRAAQPKPSQPASYEATSAIVDLYDRQAPIRGPYDRMTMACPEFPSAVTFSQGADRAFNVFFRQHDIPRGEVLANQIREIVDNYGYGTPLPGWPAERLGPIHLLLHEQSSECLDRLEAFVNLEAGEFHLRSLWLRPPDVDSVSDGTPEPTWYGPHKLSQGLSTEGRERILDAFSAADLTYKPMHEVMPLGVSFYETTLKAERRPGGYTFTALVPTGAVAPGAERQSPDLATQFFVKRTSSHEPTTYAGPVDLAPPQPVVCPR